jgi:flagellar biogenesis protein FliO
MASPTTVLYGCFGARSQFVMLSSLLQVIAVICVLVWVMNINRFNDPALGGWASGGRGWWYIALT